MNAAAMEAGRIERDPRFSTWEEERSSLIALDYDLNGKLRALEVYVEEEAYRAAEREGFDEEYCAAQASKVAAERNLVKGRLAEVRKRLALIGPSVRKERSEQSVADTSYKDDMLAVLNRIADSLSKIANALPCKVTK